VTANPQLFRDNCSSRSGRTAASYLRPDACSNHRHTCAEAQSLVRAVIHLPVTPERRGTTHEQARSEARCGDLRSRGSRLAGERRHPLTVRYLCNASR
jgi:hypothetical protein